MQKKLIHSIAAFFLLFIFSNLIFYFDISLQLNSVKTIEKNNSEFKVYGRLAKSAQDGAFSSSGFLGFCYKHESEFENKIYDSGPGNNASQWEYYLNGTCPAFDPYKSNPGFIALLYQIVSNHTSKEWGPRLVASSLLAATFSSILLWLGYEFSFFSSFLALGLTCAFPWFVGFGNNIGLAIGSMYLPLATGLWINYFKKTTWIVTATALSLFATLMLSGPEFIFATLGTCFLPSIYYSIKRNEPWKYNLNQMLAVVKAVAFATVGALAILATQHITLNGLNKTIEYFVYTIGKRTFGSPTDYNTLYASSLEVSRLDILKDYLTIPATSIYNIEIKFLEIILFFTALSIVIFYQSKEKKHLKPFLAMTWLSILCPLSWLILCAPHAYLHRFMDPFVWHLPFLPFLAMFLAIFIHSYVQNKFDKF